MSTIGTSVILLGILLTAPARASTSTRWSDAQSSPAQVATVLVATHATKGVVKSIDATSLVITRSAMKAKDMAFVMDAATQREGHVAVGAIVEVRYRSEEKQQVATAIRVQEHHPSAAAERMSPRY